MPLALLIVRNLAFVAALAYVGRLAVGLFGWRRRRENPIYQLFGIVVAPVQGIVRRVIPRAWVHERLVAILGFLLVTFVYVALGLVHRSVCLADPSQSGCLKWKNADYRTSP